MEYIAGNCPRCDFLVIQPKLDYLVSSTTTRLCLECMRIATSPPYTYSPGFHKAMELPYVNKPQIDLGIQCSTILKCVFPQTK
jgi:hypothetical protein